MIADLLFERLPETLFITKDQFLESLAGWEIEPFEIEGDLAFVTLTKGPEFHFQVFGTKHPISMTLIRTWLQKVIDAHGHVATKTPKEDARQHRFNRRFGFYVTGEDEFDVHYRLDRLPHA